jgi:hypothetical protein
MTEKDFQELFDALCATEGLNVNKARLVATWTLAARGFMAHAVDCLPHLVLVGTTKGPRDRAISLVAAAIKGHIVDLRIQRRGIVRIDDYDELSKEDADIVRNLLLRPKAPMRRPVLMGCGWLSIPDSMQAIVVQV